MTSQSSPAPALAGLRGPTGLPDAVRVRPDVAAVTREFDYAVPELWKRTPADFDLRVGGRVRVELHGRRVGGWITDLSPVTPTGIKLSPLKKWSGHGPSREVMELCDWAAHNWAGAPAKLLRTASPQRNTYRLHAPKVERFSGDVEPWAAAAFDDQGSVALVAPGADRWPLVVAAAAHGNPLVLVPTIEAASRLAGRVRRAGLHVALLPDDWDRAMSGAVVIGTRAAAFAPVHEMGAVLMLDEHDEIWREERTPTWHARDVVVERARRAGVPCVLASPAPSAEAVQVLRLREPDRATEHGGWPTVELLDRRDEPPGRLGLFSEGLARRFDGESRVACILNRTGRVRLLACVACGELGACEKCTGAVRQLEDRQLVCVRCGQRRPAVCASCGGSRLKNLVIGVSKAREELEALINEPVGEHTATTFDRGDARVVIGTEALLRETQPRGSRFRTIIFLDFDQHLTAMRQTAEVDAMLLMILAARQVGARRGGGRLIVQTRMPDHRVLAAAANGNGAALTSALAEQARSMGWPPAVAQAQISGAGAQEFIDKLGRPLGLTVVGPRDETWLVRSPDRELLLGEIDRVERGEGRLRIALS